jgi:hypothetical protein
MSLVVKILQARFLILLLLANAISGCASSSSFIATHQITIKKVSPEQTHIDNVFMRKADKGITVGGTVTFARSIMGVPPGSMEVTILVPDGKVLYNARSDYYRYGNPIRESNTFNFSLTIPVTLPKGSILELVHHTSE